MRRLLTLVFVIGLCGPASAQVYPDYAQTTVNDFADMIDPETEARITAELEALVEETGVEFAVVTLSSVAFYANDTEIPDYAADLFDDWGIGDAEANDGILMLVFRDDRELWIELGAGYEGKWDAQVQSVVDGDILPAFREGEFPAGIEAGVIGMIDDVVTPFYVGDAPPASDSGGGVNAWMVMAGFFGIPIALIAGWIGIRKRREANEPCESCGKTGLQRERHTLQAATQTSKGAGETRKTCPHCGHVSVVPFVIPLLSSSSSTSGSSGSSFGGGSSGGGGGGGNW